MSVIKQMFPVLCCKCKNPILYIIAPINSLEIPLNQTVLMSGKMPAEDDVINECPSCRSTLGGCLFDLQNDGLAGEQTAH